MKKKLFDLRICNPQRVVRRRFAAAMLVVNSLLFATALASAEDHLRLLQESAFDDKTATWGFWGTDAKKYITWKNHSNRLIPIYTFGITLDGYRGKHSIYRVASGVKKLYGDIPKETVNPDADYLDQTDVWHLQMRAVEELNKKYVFLVVFDGMDWVVSRLASIAKLNSAAYDEGRGSGLWFQDYDRVISDFGFMVTSPHNRGTRADVDTQMVLNPGGLLGGGYSAERGGATPWDDPEDHRYLIGRGIHVKHVVTDSASSATSMTAGRKTYNGAINVDHEGKQLQPIAHWLQNERGFAVGAVTSVPISHATPASAYANNVSRGDYQDLSRDLLGLPSVAHPEPLEGLDVLIGCGWGEEKERETSQGTNFVDGNRYLAEDDMQAVDVRNGGKYVVAQCQPGRPGNEVLRRATRDAIEKQARLFGFFGRNGHLPYRTADGRFDPIDQNYASDVVTESPRLAEMTTAAIDVLSQRAGKFWLMIEAGDVDWACHDNNIDNAVGAVFCGDDALRVVSNWLEQRDAWDDAAVVVTADHGHYFVLTDPQALISN